MPTAMKIRQCPAWLPKTAWCWPSGLSTFSSRWRLGSWGRRELSI